MTDDYLLPYRTDGDDLVRFLEARARGRSLDQISALNFSRKNFDGTLVTARVLGFLDGESAELTREGREFALASAAEARRRLLLRKMMAFDPYGLLLESIAEAADASTPTDWLERWWATHGYGSSQTNRAEASTAFARLTEFLGLGSYLQGRRGHVSRIEWTPGAKDKVRRLAAEGGDEGFTGAGHELEEEPAESVLGSDDTQDVRGVYLKLPLAGGRVATIQLPSRVTSAEKDRLMTLLEHLVSVEPDFDDEDEALED